MRFSNQFLICFVLATIVLSLGQACGRMEAQGVAEKLQASAGHSDVDPGLGAMPTPVPVPGAGGTPAPRPSATSTPAPTATPAPSPTPIVQTGPTPFPDIASAYVQKNWSAIRAQVSVYASESGFSTYNLQIVIQPFVEWIVEKKRIDLAQDVLDVYEPALSRLTTETNANVYGGADGNGSGYSIVQVLAPYQAWMSSGTPRVEMLLDSTQFLFGVSRLVSALDATDPRVKLWVPVLKSHYLRWIRGNEADPKKGPFQVNGWGCAKGRFNHYEDLKNKLAKAYGNRFSYCNAVLDSDMWILAGTVQLFQFHLRQPELKIFTQEEATYLLSYFKIGTDLMDSRMTNSMVTVDGVKETGLHFDAGAWRDHPGSSFAGFQAATFPTGNPVLGPATVNFDISHMRRIIPVLVVLESARTQIGASFPTAQDVRQAALQLSFGVFNGDYSQPFFTNYSDGTNGWYRVNYNDRMGFGYHPSSMSSSWLDAGYCQFASYEPRIRKICSSLLARVQGSDAVSVAYKQKLRQCFTNNYKPANCASLSAEQVNTSVLSFISSLR